MTKGYIFLYFKYQYRHEKETYQDDCCTDSSINYPVWQAAIGDSEMKMYQRVATSASVWGAWTPVSGDSHRQIVDSDTQPSGQEVGDYWLETITE